MADSEREWILVDLANFRADGPALLFIRPRRALTEEEERCVRMSTASMRIPGVQVWNVPHDFDLLAVGEAELERIGWTKLPVPAGQ